MDQCVLRKEKSEAVSGWKPITVSIELYSQLKELSEETGLALSKVACTVLEFGIERVVVKED